MTTVVARTGRIEVLQVVEDLRAVARVGEDSRYLEWVRLLNSVTPNLKRVTVAVESGWAQMPPDLKTQVTNLYDELVALAGDGRKARQPKSVFDKIWLSFSNELRLAIWEFSDASGRFKHAVERAIYDEQAQGLWEKVKGTDPDFAALHERSVQAMERGEQPVMVNWTTLRPTSM